MKNNFKILNDKPHQQKKLSIRQNNEDQVDKYEHSDNNKDTMMKKLQKFICEIYSTALKDQIGESEI